MRSRSEPSAAQAAAIEADPENAAREIVLGRLSTQARTRHELTRVLADKGVPEDAAQSVLERFVEVGLIDDEAFAGAWVESRQQRRHLSRRALRQELARKGIEPDTVTEAIGRVDDEDELDAARALVERKARSMGALTPEVRRRRLAGALARRGFGGSVCSQVLGELGDADEG